MTIENVPTRLAIMREISRLSTLVPMGKTDRQTMAHTVLSNDRTKSLTEHYYEIALFPIIALTK